jgi:hypothetical protein
VLLWDVVVVVVMVQYKNLSFLVVSDQGESEMYLRTLLRQMYAARVPSLVNSEALVLLLVRKQEEER